MVLTQHLTLIEVSVSVCPSIFSAIVNPIDFVLGWCISEDPKDVLIVECEALRSMGHMY